MSNLDDALQLSVTDFRSIAGTVTVQLDAPIILIHGPNGTGKTSLLSALELALTGDIRSMRDDDTNFARHIVHEGANETKVAITGRHASVPAVGSFVIANGVLTGTPYLDGVGPLRPIFSTTIRQVASATLPVSCGAARLRNDAMMLSSRRSRSS
jgi:exonuclease SbcC